MPRQPGCLCLVRWNVIHSRVFSRVGLLRVYAAAGACYIAYESMIELSRYHAISRVGLLRVYAAAGAEVGELERVVDNEDVLRLRHAHIIVIKAVCTTVMKTSIASFITHEGVLRLRRAHTTVIKAVCTCIF